MIDSLLLTDCRKIFLRSSSSTRPDGERSCRYKAISTRKSRRLRVSSFLSALNCNVNSLNESKRQIRCVR